eukprot:m.467998 g.467998  ORF g.467998 m.467998 type:complete len:305 (-) comp20367_c1_seq8:372-1286(-)
MRRAANQSFSCGKVPVMTTVPLALLVTARASAALALFTMTTASEATEMVASMSLVVPASSSVRVTAGTLRKVSSSMTWFAVLEMLGASFSGSTGMLYTSNTPLTLKNTTKFPEGEASKGNPGSGVSTTSLMMAAFVSSLVPVNSTKALGDTSEPKSPFTSVSPVVFLMCIPASVREKTTCTTVVPAMASSSNENEGELKREVSPSSSYSRFGCALSVIAPLTSCNRDDSARNASHGACRAAITPWTVDEVLQLCGDKKQYNISHWNETPNRKRSLGAVARLSCVGRLHAALRLSRRGQREPTQR